MSFLLKSCLVTGEHHEQKQKDCQKDCKYAARNVTVVRAGTSRDVPEEKSPERRESEDCRTGNGERSCAVPDLLQLVAMRQNKQNKQKQVENAEDAQRIHLRDLLLIGEEDLCKV